MSDKSTTFSQKNDKNETHATAQKTGISSEKLNLIIALCAILISAASFYATYLQADAAERQVKAMTLPLVQFTSGNWDNELRKQELTLTLKNAGVGPAIIKRIDYKYQGKSYASLPEFYRACCEVEASEYFNRIKENIKENKVETEGIYITAPLINSILPGQEETPFLTFALAKENQKFWQKLNNERFHLTLKVCYCSLLGECYNTEKNGIVEPVEYCPVRLEKSKLL